ncbi:MAG TPA: hypothetical protein VKS22_08300 [Candidatus Binataceae bacterium]|nr:hypothetical protein [Candidatus Binataceae bacterium]
MILHGFSRRFFGAFGFAPLHRPIVRMCLQVILSARAAEEVNDFLFIHKGSDTSFAILDDYFKVIQLSHVGIFDVRPVNTKVIERVC